MDFLIGMFAGTLFTMFMVSIMTANDNLVSNDDINEKEDKAMIKLPTGTKRACEEEVKTLIALGVLYVDEAGIHANSAGVYRLTRGMREEKEKQ